MQKLNFTTFISRSLIGNFNTREHILIKDKTSFINKMNSMRKDGKENFGLNKLTLTLTIYCRNSY